MKLKAKASDGIDDDGNVITIFEVQGDPLSLLVSGVPQKEVQITVPDTEIEHVQTINEDFREMCSDEGVIKRNVAYATKNNIKWDHLDCKQFECTCKGPYCTVYLGHDDYSKCPEARWKV
jgi:hypothetical protein